MKRVILSALLALSLSGLAAAKTPPEVLKPYKQYRAALEAGDDKLAFQSAKSAFKTAERLLGDSKLTGDLAANFGGQETSGIYTYQDYKDRLEAWRRAAELARFYEADAAEVELERRLELIEHSFTLKERRNGRQIIGGKGNEFKQMEVALDRLGKRGSTLEGDMEVMRARWLELKKNHKKALQSAQKAQSIYATANDGIISQYKVMGILYRANGLRQTGQDVQSALAYQDLMDELKGVLQPNHRLVNTAFSGWVRARAKLVKDGKLAAAKAAGMGNPWPFDYYDKRGKAIFKMEPQYFYKNNARTRIKQTAESGLLIVQFDLDSAGSPINIKFNSAPNKPLEEPFLEAFKQWLYTPHDSDVIPSYRKNLTMNYSMQFIDDLNRNIE